jgi:hypothetical protein
MDLDPYVAKPIQRTASLDHEPDCAVIKYGPVVCTCGALNRWVSGFIPELPVVDGFAAIREA